MDLAIEIAFLCMGMLVSISFYKEKKQKLIGLILCEFGYALAIATIIIYRFGFLTDMLWAVLLFVGLLCVFIGMIKPVIMSIKGVTDIFRDKK